MARNSHKLGQAVLPHKLLARVGDLAHNRACCRDGRQRVGLPNTPTVWVANQSRRAETLWGLGFGSNALTQHLSFLIWRTIFAACF